MDKSLNSFDKNNFSNFITQTKHKHIFNNFEIVSQDLLKYIVKTVKNKFSSVDNIPKMFLETINSSILNILLDIVNQSLQTRKFPDSLKICHVFITSVKKQQLR